MPGIGPSDPAGNVGRIALYFARRGQFLPRRKRLVHRVFRFPFHKLPVPLLRLQRSILYRNPTTGRWTVIPWDVDLLNEEFDRWGPDGVEGTESLEQFRRCLTHPELEIRFQNRARELRDPKRALFQVYLTNDVLVHW